MRTATAFNYQAKPGVGFGSGSVSHGLFYSTSDTRGIKLWGEEKDQRPGMCSTTRGGPRRPARAPERELSWMNEISHKPAPTVTELCELATPPGFGECASALGLVLLLLFTPVPGEEASVSGQKCRCCFTSCLALGRATGSPFARNTETHKPEQNPGHLPRSAFRSASLRFPTTTTTSGGHRVVPTELCPTGPDVFCGSASHSLPLFVCNMTTHRRWCSASCLATKTKTHHR